MVGALEPVSMLGYGEEEEEVEVGEVWMPSCLEVFSAFDFFLGGSLGVLPRPPKSPSSSLLSEPGLPSPRCRSMCSFNLSCLAKLFPQRSQANGLSPVCVRMCRLR